jgi:hypothetical protein
LPAVSELTMRFTKWGGAPHWHFPMEALGSDDHGAWFMVRAGTRLQRGVEPPITRPDGFVVLVPRHGSWIASWNHLDDVAVYVDVTTEPLADADCVTAVDLDLDVVRWRNGLVEVLDVDEFDSHQVDLGYPPDVVAGARATLVELVEAVEAEAPPFEATGQAWLELACSRWAT